MKRTINDCQKLADRKNVDLKTDEDGELFLQTGRGGLFESNLSHEARLVTGRGMVNPDDLYEQIEEVLALGFTECLISGCCGND